MVLPSNFYSSTANVTEGTKTYSWQTFVNSIMYNCERLLFVGMLINYTPLNSSDASTFWAGISYSKSYVFRDMVTMQFTPNSVVVRDCFSMFAAAPYEDTSTSIGGADNLNKILAIH